MGWRETRALTTGCTACADRACASAAGTDFMIASESVAVESQVGARSLYGAWT